MQKYEQNMLSQKDIMINNFLGGIFFGLGTTIGVSIVLTILGFIASKVNFIPIVGNFVSEVLHYVLQNNPHSH